MADLRFDEQVAIVTGAGNGLGRAYARFLAARGARVVANDIGTSSMGRGFSEAPADAVVREIVDAGGRAVADTNTVAEEQSAAMIVRRALEAFGRLDILVNNAGISIMAPFAELSSADFVKVINTDMMGVVWMCRAAWPHMQKASYGRIVNITSTSFLGHPTLAAYVTARAGTFGLTRTLGLEGIEYNIKVNALSPVAGTRAVMELLEESELKTWMMTKLTPDIVAPAVALLAHRECPITGQCLSSGGGRVNLVFWGETHGYVNRELTVEALHENFAQVMDRTNYEVPASVLESADFNAWKLGHKQTRAASGEIQWQPKEYEREEK
jgi:NAD(P)-dependent dehydrogenase (short-subunit alcohol dehydrogenase family)